MTFIIDFGRDGGCGPLWNWRPGRYRSRVVYRGWWGPVAVSKLRVSHLEYASTSYDWIGG